MEAKVKKGNYSLLYDFTIVNLLEKGIKWMDCLVSVIIPVYNMQDYLRRCLDSIINQTLKEIEIIIVNDGSTDSSKKICEEYCEKDSRVILINKENGGVAAARNIGIQNAHAEYLMFLDSDDWVTPDFCESAYRAAVGNKADLVLFDFYNVNSKKRTYPGRPTVEMGMLSKEQAMDYVFSGIGSFAWNKLYKAELFDDICFPEGRSYEDIGIIHLIIDKAQKIYCLKIPLYYYFYRDNSIANKENKRSLADNVRMSSAQMDFLEEHAYHALDYSRMRVIVVSMRYLIKFDTNDDNELKKMIDSNIKKMGIKEWKHLGGKTKILFIIYRICPSLFNIICKIAGERR